MPRADARPAPGRPAGACARAVRAGVALLLVLAAPLLAHGPDHEVVVRITEELRRDPGNVRLLLDRGERLRSHGDLDAARADFAEALRIDPAFQPARVRLALVARAAGRTNEALALLDETLAREPDHLLALSARADLRVRAGMASEAVRDYDEVIRRARPARPELYLARARAQIGASSNAVPAALEGLGQGLRELGPVPALESMSLALERESGQVEAALRRIARLAAAAERRERWLAERGDVLHAARRDAEAADAYRDAVAAIDALPDRQRRTIATADLRRELEAKLAALAPRRPQSSPSP